MFNPKVLIENGEFDKLSLQIRISAAFIILATGVLYQEYANHIMELILTILTWLAFIYISIAALRLVEHSKTIQDEKNCVDDGYRFKGVD